MNQYGLEPDCSLVPSLASDVLFGNSASPAMKSLERMALEIAATDLPVFIVGESGSGKGVISGLIHRLSLRSKAPQSVINCSGIASAKITQWRGDGKRVLGFDREHAKGTVVLDEVLEMCVPFQLYLTELLSGANGHAPLRIIACSSGDPEEAIRKGRFREVLYYRLKGVLLSIPPLRARREDIPSLVEFLCKKYAEAFARPVPVLRTATQDFFLTHRWPGNVRELENVIKAIVLLGEQDLVIDGLRNEAPSSRAWSATAADNRVSLKQAARRASQEVEKNLMAEVLRRTGWNRKRAAQELQISYKALLYKLKQVGLTEQPIEE